MRGHREHGWENIYFYTHVDVFRNFLAKEFLEVSTIYPKEKLNLGGGFFLQNQASGDGCHLWGPETGLKLSFSWNGWWNASQALRRLVLHQGVGNHVLWEIFTSWLFSWQPLKVGIGGISVDYKWISYFRSRWQGSDFQAEVFVLLQGFGNCQLWEYLNIWLKMALW